HSRGFRHRAAKQYWVEDQEVLKKYKETHGPDHITGRGGAGAKGHVNIKGWIPNQERALAKEKDVMKKWQEKKKVNGGIRMGRGGR
ncbi:2617_t:CDS:2, partial [Acaulospora colombiana]